MKGLNMRVFEPRAAGQVIGVIITLEEPPFWSIAYVEVRPGKKPLVTLVKPEAVRVNEQRVEAREDRGYDFRLLNVDPYRGAQA